MRQARQSLALFLGVDPLELVFTSGGSEANNLALKGVCTDPQSERRQILISAVEHPSLHQTAAHLARQGFDLDVIPVDRQGCLNLNGLKEKLSERTLLVSVQMANNETGHIFPLSEIAQLSHAVGALVHCDAVQALGKIPMHPRDLGIDMASFSGHKFYSLKGCGALYVRRGLKIESLIHGGGQERGRRAGTENVLAMASLGRMCDLFAHELKTQSEHLLELRDHLELRVLNEIPEVQVTGREGLRLPNTSHMVLTGVDGETLLMNLDVRGFAVSTGAACSSGSPEPSPVLLAMGLARSEAQSSLRVSLGWGNTRAEVDRFVDELKIIVNRLRSFKHGERFAYGV